MKHLFLISTVFMGFLLGQGLQVFAFASDALLERVFDEAEVALRQKPDAKEVEQLAKTGEFPFEHLFLNMYENVKTGAQNAAISAVAKQMNFDEAQTAALILEGDLSAIVQSSRPLPLSVVAERQADIEKSLGELGAEAEALSAEGGEEAEARLSEISIEMRALALQSEALNENSSLGTQAEANARLTRVLELYQEELAFYTSLNSLGYESVAKELFYNGDPSDSAGVDLLSDLDLIHVILFNEGLALPDRSGIELSSVEDELLLSSLNSEISRPKVRVPGGLDPSLVLTNDFNPYACFVDEELTLALDEFDSILEEDEAAIPGGAGRLGEDGRAVSPVLDGAGEPIFSGRDFGTAPSVSSSEALRSFNNALNNLNAPAGDFSRELRCNERFCVTVNLVTGTWGTTEGSVASDDFLESDNCVSCHVRYIQEHMDNLMSKSLVPNKLSNNFGEDASCKLAALDVLLDFNITAVPKPIVLDPGEDLISDAAEQSKDLREELQVQGILPIPGRGESDLGESLADQERTRQENLRGLAGFIVTLDEATDQAIDAAEVIAAMRGDIYNSAGVSGSVVQNAQFYEQVSSQLTQMYLYFEGMDKALKNTVFADDAPLPALAAKPYCQ